MKKSTMNDIDRIRRDHAERVSDRSRLDDWITINGTHVETKDGSLQGAVGAKISSTSKGGGKSGGSGTAKRLASVGKKLDHSRDVEAVNDYIDAVISQNDPAAEYPEDPSDYNNENTVTCKNDEEKRELIDKWLGKAISDNNAAIKGLKDKGADDSHSEVEWRNKCGEYYKNLRKELAPRKGK